jgi:hypothetical protein
LHSFASFPAFPASLRLSFGEPPDRELPNPPVRSIAAMKRIGRTFVSVSWLDVKLGLRMFAKYPALSIVAVLGMSLAITIGAGYFAFIGAMLDSTLPIDEGDREVMIENRFIAGPDTGDTNRASEHDFAQWRGALKSVEDLAAFRDES